MAHRRGALTLTLFIVAAAPASAGEMLRMPFACSVQAGRPVLTAGIEYSYPIVSQRLTRSFATCGFEPPQRCRAWTVHRFEVACMGGRVPWVTVAAALGNMRHPNGFSLDSGRLGVALAPGLGARSTVMPAGYAPVESLGARIVPAFGRPAAAAAIQAVPAERVPNRAAETVRAALHEVAIEPTAMREHEIDPESPFLSLVSQASWAPVVTQPRERPDDRRLQVVAIIGLMLMGLLAVVGVQLRRVSSTLAGGAALKVFAPGADKAAFAAASSDDELMFLRGEIAEIARRLGEARSIIAGLERAAALRALLESELAVLDERLGVAMAAQSERAPAVAQVRHLLTALTAEAHRIVRIAESATADGALSVTLADGAMPSDRHEACAVLGINADATESVAKKVVDALRQSWHPDLARDLADRVAREARMKQINVAWDVLRGRD